MILASKPTFPGHKRIAIKLYPLCALLLLTLQSSYAQKPAEWEAAVQSATISAPTFWLNSDPSTSTGSIQFDGLLRYSGAEWVRFEDGPWGDALAAFGLPPDAARGATVVSSAQKDIACSDEGALAVLFRAPSIFDQDEPQIIIARGTYDRESRFELGIYRGRLRLAYNQGGAVKVAWLMGAEEGAWTWVALSWRKIGAETEISWRAWTRNSGLHQGVVTADRAGDQRIPLILAGRTVRCTLADGVLSQVIIWDTPVGEDGWNKLEALLPND
jgi:hypothetical protein